MDCLSCLSCSVFVSGVIQYEIELDITNASLKNLAEVDILVENVSYVITKILLSLDTIMHFNMQVSSLFSGGRLVGTDGIFYSIVEDPRTEKY